MIHLYARHKNQAYPGKEIFVLHAGIKSPPDG
jgi:hypothetical protein